MARFVTGNTFGTTDTVTAALLNQAVNDAAISTDSVDGSTIEINSNALRIKDSGVTKAKIENVANMKVLGNTSGSATAPQEVSILDEDNMSTNSATSLATQQSIKAYVTAMRPKFVTLTGGTTDLTKTNPSDGSTAVYNIADFTSSDSDFATTKITGLIVEGVVASKTNTNLIQASLPGVSTIICRTVDTGGNGVSDQATAFIPINSDTSTFTLTYTVGNTAFSTHCESIIKGAIIHPGLYH
jgi:hypothetical protein